MRGRRTTGGHKTTAHPRHFFSHELNIFVSSVWVLKSCYNFFLLTSHIRQGNNIVPDLTIKWRRIFQSSLVYSMSVSHRSLYSWHPFKTFGVISKIRQVCPQPLSLLLICWSLACFVCRQYMSKIIPQPLKLYFVHNCGLCEKVSIVHDTNISLWNLYKMGFVFIVLCVHVVDVPRNRLKTSK